MTKFLWCSVHQPTKEQQAELTQLGQLVYLKDVFPSLQESINNCPPDRPALSRLAIDFAQLALTGYTIVQPGGSLLFQFMLGQAAQDVSMSDRFLYAHSERISVDVAQSDGSVVKTSVFKHLGFY